MKTPSDTVRKSATRTLQPLDAMPRGRRVPWTVWVVFCPAPIEQSQVIELDEQPLNIGRDDENSEGKWLLLPDPLVSRHHAVLRLPSNPMEPSRSGESGPMLSDWNSKNGLSVNGRAVRETTLFAGDVIRLGESILVIGHGRPAIAEDTHGLGLIGRSAPLHELRKTIRQVGPSALAALIIGPTGTGKELIARALHAASHRSGLLVTVNCAALPATLIENLLFGHRKGAYTGAYGDETGAFVRSHGGTLFLDEVGELPLESQPKLLRALESGEITPLGASQAVTTDTRIVAATNVDLRAAVQAGRFREDLYARLAGIVMRTPLLRERREDILPLLRHYLPAAVRARPMTEAFVEQLLLYDWPGNIRELVKLAERLAVLHPSATQWEAAMLTELEMPPIADDATTPPAEPANEDPTNEDTPQADIVQLNGEHIKLPPSSREELEALLKRAGGNVSLLAQMVGRNRKQVYRWMDRFGMARGKGPKDN